MCSNLVDRIRLVGVSALLAAVAALARGAETLPVAMPETLLPKLDELLTKAVSQSPQQILRRIELASAEATRVIQVAGLYPTVSGNISYSRYESEIADDRSASSTPSVSNGLNYSFALNQPLFHWGALKAQADIGRVGRKMAEQQFIEGYRSLAVSIRAQYLGLITKKIAVRNQRNAVRLMEANLATQEERLRTGVISPGEIIEPRLQVEEARIGRDRAELDYEASRSILAQLVGTDSISDDDVPSTMPRPTYSNEVVASYLRGAAASIEALPYARFYEMQADQADLNYKIARTRLLPKLGLAANYGVSNNANVTTDATGLQATVNTDVKTSSIGVAANWTIFDGFSARGQKLSALAQRRSAERALKTFKDTTLLQLQTLERQLGFSARLVELTGTRLDLATDAVRLTSENVRFGRATSNSLESITQGAYGSELNAAYARVDYYAKWSEYISLLGLDPVMSKLPARISTNVQ